MIVFLCSAESSAIFILLVEIEVIQCSIAVDIYLTANLIFVALYLYSKEIKDEFTKYRSPQQ